MTDMEPRTFTLTIPEIILINFALSDHRKQLVENTSGGESSVSVKTIDSLIKRLKGRGE